MVEIPRMQGTIMHTDQLAAMRLFQLISPSLPTGAFTYSQGVEWAVECGWVRDRDSLVGWLNSLLFSGFRELEIPLLKRLYCARSAIDIEAFSYWSNYTVACRETRELRQEEVNRGRAMAKLIDQLCPELEEDWMEVVKTCQIAGFALAASSWNIELEQAALGYTWGWLENMVMSAVKIVPLGQTAGQQALAALITTATDIVASGLVIEDKNIGGSCPAFAIGSCLHETQYTRLFRS
jgi:urease accessory protein